VLSTNKDKLGNTFISTWEGNNYPVYGIQWHAEKNQFEWNPDEVIQHTADAIYAMQYFGRYLVDQARMSNHQFPTYQEEYKSLIYNYSPIYSEAIVSDFEQCYVF